MEALAVANERRLARARERKELRGAPPSVLVPALVHPSDALGSYSLAALFGRPPSTKRHGIVVRFGPVALNRVLEQLTAEHPLGRRWHAGIRLRDLTEKERRRLVRAILEAVGEVEAVAA